MRILIADDEKGVRDLLRRVLSEDGYDLVTVEDGEECLDRIGNEHYDMVIADLKMPHVSGLEVLDRLSTPHAASTFIMTTGYPTLDGALAVMEQGGNDYVVKPFDIAELRRIIRECLAGPCDADILPLAGRGIVAFFLEQMSRASDADACFLLLGEPEQGCMTVRPLRSGSWREAEDLKCRALRALASCGGPDIPVSRLLLNVTGLQASQDAGGPAVEPGRMVTRPVRAGGEVRGVIGEVMTSSSSGSAPGHDLLGQYADMFSRILESGLTRRRLERDGGETE